MVKLKLYRPTDVMRTFWGLDDALMPSFSDSQNLDIYEKDGKVFVEAAVAGIKPENIHVTFEEGLLRIDAKEEEHEEEKQKKGYYRNDVIKEYHYTTSLPRPVNTDAIEAKIEHGMIVITAPVAEAAKAKRIEVKSNK